MKTLRIPSSHAVERLLTASVLCSLVGCGGGADDSNAAGGAGGQGGGGAAGGVAGASGGDGGTGGDRAAATGPLPSPGCDASVVAAGKQHFTTTHNGLDREYNLYVPASYDAATPAAFIVNIHGLTSNMDQQEVFSGMNPKADAEGYIVAYPNGLGDPQSWEGGACCAPGESRDDVGFIRKLVTEVSESACIDMRRVYATGMSNGGFMSHRLGCEAADVFAAVAPVAGVNGISPCEPSRPMPVIHFHGTADTLVAYDGGGFPSVAESTAGWVDRNGCEAEPEVTFQNGAATCETYSGCDAGVEVTLCTIEGEGHCWPGTTFCPFGDFTTDIDADDEMWKFFQRFSLP